MQQNRTTWSEVQWLGDCRVAPKSHPINDLPSAIEASFQELRQLKAFFNDLQWKSNEAAFV
jgi:hypothetical protein